MKTKNQNLLGALALLAILTLDVQLSTCFAQTTAFTYQGRVTDNGTNFNGAGQFEFALVNSTNANHTATATVAAGEPSGGYITGYTVTGGGSGYVTAPAVTVFGGGGSGATAIAHLTGDTVTSITVNNTGNGLYTGTPTVTVAPPPPAITYTTYWSNDGTSVNGGEPSAIVNVAVNNGLFTVVLGDATIPNMAAMNAALFSQPDLELRIWFSDGVNGFKALDPAQPLTPAPYAVMAQSANGLPGLMIQQNTNDAPNVIGGSSVNFVASGVVGATISGGGAVGISGFFNYTNSVTAAFGTVSGGAQNMVVEDYSTIGGGFENTASGYEATVGGGYDNTASGDNATVAGGGGYYGGDGNTASGDWSTVGGGYANIANGYEATIAGGAINASSGIGAVIGGGSENHASDLGTTVAGGGVNQATNAYATVPGGYYNVAGGQFSFAAGQNAQALNDGAFVWADSQSATFSSTTNDEFSIRAQNGVRIQADKGIHLNAADEPLIVRDWNPFATNAPADKVGIGRWGLFMEPHYLTLGMPSDDIANCNFQIAKYSTNGTATALLTVNQSGNVTTLGTVTANGVLLTSDRNAKEHFAPVSSQTVLAKVAALPMTEWNYKTDAASQKHLGPMAQDFHAAFGLDGADDKHISLIDEGGVALAAIQGLNQKLNEKDAEIQDLKQRLDRLEKMISDSTDKQ